MGRKIVIVGGVAGGASCATRARRLDQDAEIVMIDKGPFVSFANCGLPYYIGGTIEERDKLLAVRPEMFRDRFRIDVRTEHECVRIDREAKEIEIRDLRHGRTYRERYDVLVLSPGAKPIRPALPGIDLPGILALRDIPDMDAIVRRLDDLDARPRRPEETEAKKAIVLGGGYIGLEMAENLRDRGLEVTLVEKLSQVMPASLDPEMAAHVHRTLRQRGVELRLQNGVTAFEKGREEGRLNVRLERGDTLPCDLAILSIGVRPDTQLGADAGLAIGERGGYVVNEQMQTNDPCIYAVGDAVETMNLTSGYPMLCALAGPANRQGRLAADHIVGKDVAYRGSQATAICKVFDLTVAAFGLTTARCNELGIPNYSVHVAGASHATYYPGAGRLLIKVVFGAGDGRILGGQIVGTDGVDKRADVLATAQRAGMTVYDLQHLELAYAPPYGSAKDPINMVGFVAVNHLEGDIPLAYWNEVESIDPQRQVVLDVCTAPERSQISIPGSIHVPLDSLRECLDEVPRDKELLVHCRAGGRSAYATRILLQNGFRARNVDGGMNLYSIRHFLAEGTSMPPGRGGGATPIPGDPIPGSS